MPPSAAAKNAAPKRPIAPGDVKLQEALHLLLNRLAKTIDQVKNWPEATGDDASIHVETTSKLITSIREIISQIQQVEGIVQADMTVRKSLNECLVPLDLLDLLDTSLNPECFSRGLLREALGQLAGLKRRKLALALLGAAVQSGLNKRLQEVDTESKKRSRSEDDDGTALEPPKNVKQRTEL
ncbi:hypothetical protein MPSEU_001059000 [Mayamaea pseudoterrestris]|nr:hypothetical protein MPSEU_001059000 [Mayamaea pseudoterrestris]